MFKIGVTGGIGSGKTTIAKLLSDYTGAPIIDADKIARELVVPGSTVLENIVSEFDDILLSDGNLNRPKLGSIIFTDKKQREKLNRIMFPAIHNAVLDKFYKYDQAEEKYVIYDAPLLFESSGHQLVDFIAMVYAPEDVRIKRIQQRNNLSESEARARIASQLRIDELERELDFLVYNTSDINGLQNIIINLWIKIKEMDLC